MNAQAEAIIKEIQSEAVQTKTVQELIEEALIPQGIEIPKPENVFAIDNIPVFTKKSISTLKGKAKAGKTTCTAWVTAKIINEGMKAIWIDTEQGQYYGSRTQSWVLKIAGHFTHEGLFYYDLRQYNTKIRIEMVRALIESMNPDLVIIDGIRDLVFDINSAEEATITSSNLMAWATINDCHILCIIHENKSSDNARGHLGTEMINKSETVIKVSKDERGFTLCEPELTRGEPFSPFAFQRDSYGIPQMVDYVPKVSGGESNSKKVLPVDIAKETHLLTLKQAFGSHVEMIYKDLVENISAAFEMYGTAMGVVRTKSFIAFYKQQLYLIPTKKEKTAQYYEINPSYL